MKLVLTNQYAEFLLLANGLIVLMYFYMKKKKKQRAMEFGNYETLKKVAGGDFIKASNILLITRVVALTMLIVGISSPTIIEEKPSSRSDYVLAIDTSGSMSATDIDPNRLEASKSVSNTFISGLGNQSSVGVLSFAGEVNQEFEVDSDREAARAAIDGIDMGDTAGTAIGNAISTSVSMLLGSDEGRVVLVTDGQNNVGSSVNESIKFAQRQNVSVYPIGIGEENDSRRDYRIIEGENVSGTSYPNIDQQQLQHVANATNGTAKFVSNRTALETAFVDIVSTEVENDVSHFFIWLAALLLVLEWVVKTTNFEVIP